ncbi:MAG: hypothetical protein ACOC32_01245 [Nanoarchaeota archaeon]
MKKIISLLLLLMLAASVNAKELQPQEMKMQLQSLDNYVVSLDFQDDTLVDVRQSFDVVNRFREPIIPGRAKLILVGDIRPTDISISIGWSRKGLADENVILEDGNYVIYYEIWRPITKGEKLDVTVDFTTELNPQGILFKQLNLNFGEPEIPIEKMALNLNLPSGKSLTYANPEAESAESGSVMIEIPRSLIKQYQEEPITVEYSSLPLPTLPFNGYWLWLVLIVMSAMIMMMKILSKKSMEPAAV